MSCQSFEVLFCAHKIRGRVYKMHVWANNELFILSENHEQPNVDVLLFFTLLIWVFQSKFSINVPPRPHKKADKDRVNIFYLCFTETKEICKLSKTIREFKNVTFIIIVL